MTYLEYLDDQELSDLWLDSDDDMALILNAIKPWHLDGQQHSPDLEQWFEDNWYSGTTHPPHLFRPSA